MGDEFPRSIEEALNRKERPRPAPASDQPGFYVDIRDKPAFLLAAMRLLAGGAHVSFEGDLSGCDFSLILESSSQETRTLLRNTAFPRKDFLILPLEPQTIDVVMKSVPPADLVRKVHHIQIEKGGRLELGVYDQFHPDTSWVGEAFSAELLDSLRAKTILRSWERAPSRGESMSDDFVNYVGHPDMHDGTIDSVERSGDRALVTVTGGSGRRLQLQFSGVREVVDHRSIGMRLYGLVEMITKEPWRRFVFANWDETDDARLEIMCDGFSYERPAD